MTTKQKQNYSLYISPEAMHGFDTLFDFLGIESDHKGKPNRSAGFEWLGQLAARDVQAMARVVKVREACEKDGLKSNPD